MSDPTSPEAADLERQIEALRAERDRLQEQVHALEVEADGKGRLRGVAVFVLVVLASVSFTGASVGVWAKRSFLNNEVFAARAAPLGADPAVQAALGIWITNEVMRLVDPEALFEEALPERGQILAGPLANAVGGFVQDKVDEFLRSDTFADLWAEAATRAHSRAVEVVEGTSDVVSANADQIEVNLVPLVTAALAQVGQASPEIFGRTVDLPDLTVDDLPAEAQSRLSDALGTSVDGEFGVIVIDDDGALAAAQDAVRLFGIAVWALVALTIVLVPLALWLSQRRRRTLLQLVFGIAFGLVLIRRLGFRVEGDALDRIADETNRAAARAVAHSFIDPLLDATALVLWVLLAVAVVALVTGPYRWSVALRRGVVRVWSGTVRTAGAVGERATDEATVAWLRAHIGALQIGGAALAIVLLLLFDLSWLGLLLLLLVLATYEAAVWWLGQSAAYPADAGGSSRGGGVARS